jgi:hypothetical protein
MDRYSFSLSDVFSLQRGYQRAAPAATGGTVTEADLGAAGIGALTGEAAALFASAFSSDGITSTSLAAGAVTATVLAARGATSSNLMSSAIAGSELASAGVGAFAAAASALALTEFAATGAATMSLAGGAVAGADLAAPASASINVEGAAIAGAELGSSGATTTSFQGADANAPGTIIPNPPGTIIEADFNAASTSSALFDGDDASQAALLAAPLPGAEPEMDRRKRKRMQRRAAEAAHLSRMRDEERKGVAATPPSSSHARAEPGGHAATTQAELAIAGVKARAAELAEVAAQQAIERAEADALAEAKQARLRKIAVALLMLTE